MSRLKKVVQLLQNFFWSNIHNINEHEKEKEIILFEVGFHKNFNKIFRSKLVFFFPFFENVFGMGKLKRL